MKVLIMRCFPAVRLYAPTGEWVVRGGIRSPDFGAYGPELKERQSFCRAIKEDAPVSPGSEVVIFCRTRRILAPGGVRTRLVAGRGRPPRGEAVRE